MNNTPIDDKPPKYVGILESPEQKIHNSKREWLNIAINIFLATSIAVVNYNYEVQNELPTKVGFVAGLIIMSMLLCIVLSNYAVRAHLPTKSDLLTWFWVIISLPYAAFIFSYFLFHIYVIYTKTKTIPFSSNPVYTILFAIAIICLGLLFFAFRLRQRFWYGFFEAIVGVCIATLKFYSDILLSSTLDDLTPIAIAILTGGIYLIVRGLDNMHQSLSKDKMGQRIIKFLNPPKKSS